MSPLRPRILFRRKLTVVVPQHDRGEPQGSPITAYLQDNDDSTVPRFIAARSRFPPHPSGHPSGYAGVYRPTAGTSMLLSGNSSLAALTTASSASSAPSVSSSLGERYLGPARVLEHDHQGALHIPPLRHRVVFECPFNFLHCHFRFESFPEWLAHSLTHFERVSPPEKNNCCFCDDKFERSKDGMRSWTEKMQHTALHYQLGHRLAHARPDFNLYKYLWSKRLIETANYKALIGASHSHSGASSYPSPPSSPDRSSGSNSSVFTITNAPRRHQRDNQRRQRPQ